MSYTNLLDFIGEKAFEFSYLDISDPKYVDKREKLIDESINKFYDNNLINKHDTLVDFCDDYCKLSEEGVSKFEKIVDQHLLTKPFSIVYTGCSFLIKFFKLRYRTLLKLKE